MKNHFRQCVILFILFLSLTGCSEVEDVSPEEAIMNEVAYWSSEDFEGRQAGTAANEKVRDEIEERFNKLGLQPVFGDSYLQPFNIPFLNPDEVEKRLVVHMQDGTGKEFVYGEDWMEKSSEPNLNVELPISFKDSKDNILVTERLLQPSEKIRVQFVKSESFSRVLTSYQPESGSFQITKNLYTYLKEKEKEIHKVGLVYSGRRTPITAHNVIGKIAGDNSEEKRAIVISAHFDHVGKAGKNTYLGSVDNATGLTGLLNIAEGLVEQSKEQPFSSDIIFAAFNAEESGLFGSQAFVNEISSQYDSIANINLDCIGIKDGGKIALTGSNSGSSNLSDILTSLAENKDVQIHHILEDGISLRSDHVSFLDRQYQAINLSQEKYPAIHSTEDNMGQVDAMPILKAIDLVVDFVKKNHAESFVPAGQGTYDGDYYSEYEQQLKDLAFGEYKTYKSKVTGNLETVLNLNRDLTEEENHIFRSTIENNGFQLVSAILRFNPIGGFDPTKGKIDEIRRFSDEEIEKAVLNVDIEKGREYMNIQIVLHEVELPFSSEPEVFGEWDLRKEPSISDETYSSAVKTITIQGQTHTVFIQGAFTKGTLKSFEQFFPFDTAIVFLSNKG